MVVLRARADLCGKQVFYYTNIAVYLYYYLDSIRWSWIIKLSIISSLSTTEHIGKLSYGKEIGVIRGRHRGPKKGANHQPTPGEEGGVNPVICLSCL